MPRDSTALEPVARLMRIRVAFDGRDVLHDVSLDVPGSTLTVIAGANGAGKSTLLEVMAGTRAADSGTRTVSASIAFVPQRASIPPRLPVTVRDVVNVGAWGRLGPWRRMDATARDLVHDALGRLDIERLATHPFAALSGGQQQRALLAQGLARRAALLLLDEPTTGLDAESALRIRAVLREEADRGTAVVCVSHDAAVLSDADRTLVLAEGRARSPECS